MPASEAKATEPKKLPGIFISYRRSDNPDAVGRIYDRLVSEFGKARVFKDVDSIPLGQDFRGHLNDIVGGCAAVLAIIGPRWLEARNAAGQRRLEEPDDFVRIELEAALARSVPVVPVLVAHAPMPASSELPASLASMVYRQSIEVRPDPDFHNDATRLVAALKRILDPSAAHAEVEEAVRAPHAAPNTTVRSRASRWPWIVAAAFALAAAVLAIPALKFLQQPPPREFRTEITTPATGRPQDFALSPDGRQIAFVANDEGNTRLWLRSLDSSTARSLPGTEGAMRPFWSPDSRSIAFFTSTSLRRVDPCGGQSRVLSTSSSLNPGGGSWNSDGVILYAPSVTATLLRMSASGGDPVPATQLDTAQLGHVSPAFLPDGKRFVFQAGGSPNQAGIYLGSLDGKAPPVRISDNGSLGPMLPSGWIIIARDQALVAQQLDADQSRLVGEPVVLGDVGGSVLNASSAAVTASANGLIAFRAGTGRARQLQWFDRTGRMLGNFGEPNATIGNPRISPDGRRVAVDLTVAGNIDIWVLDGARATRLTFDPQNDGRSLWTPDGRDIVFYSLRTGRLDLYRKSSEGGDEESLVLEGGPGEDRIRVPTGFSPDGRYLLYFSGGRQPGTELRVARMDGERKPMALMTTPFNENWAVCSPDGRWIAYMADETGRNEIYVMPFRPPDAAGAGAAGPQARWPVSAAGGSFPMWSRDGRELYFVSPGGDIMAAQITASATSVASGVPVKLFTPGIFGGGVEAAQGRQYDIAPDGRFLVNVALDSGPVSPITLIQNWNPGSR